MDGNRVAAVSASGYTGYTADRKFTPNGDNVWLGDGIFHGVPFNIEAEIKSVGVVPDFQMPDGVSYVLDERQNSFNALEWLDEKDKLDALSDKEKLELSQITTVKLQQLAMAAAAADTGVWTPFENAVVAIMQHDDGLGNFPQPRYKVIHHTKPVPGTKVVSADINMLLNGVKFHITSGSVSTCGGVQTRSFLVDVPIGTFPDAERFDDPNATDD